MTNTTSHSDLIAKIVAAYEAATGEWGGLSWDSELEGALNAIRVGRRVDLEEVPSAGYGFEYDDEGQRHRRAVSAAKALYEALIDDDCSLEDRAKVIEAWEAVVSEEAEKVAERAECAEEEARAALEAAKDGDFETAARRAAFAARIERQFGDAPTWGAFEDVCAEAERAVDDD